MPKCKDCIHDKVCSEYFHAFWGHTANKHSDLINADPKDCPYFKDRSRFVELPCHTGEKVWVIYLGRKEATRSLEKGEVIGFYITASLRVCTSVILEDGSTFTGTYGENVFPRKEKLEGSENNADEINT